jgi:hypothetical protein
VRLEGKFDNLIGNRNRDLQACSIVPGPTTPLRVPLDISKGDNTKIVLTETGWGIVDWIHLAQDRDQ